MSEERSAENDAPPCPVCGGPMRFCECMDDPFAPVPDGAACPTCAHPEGYDRLSGPCPTCHGEGIPPECHNGHPFIPGASTDHTPGESDPRWCNTCGEARVVPPAEKGEADA